MKTTSLILTHTIVALVIASCGQASAALIDPSYTTSIDIPDYNPKNPLGISDTKSIDIPGATSITGIKVTLSIDGGYNGDYYAYLSHGSTGFAVLLNRPGVTTSDPYGYGDSGLNVVFEDSANNDIHTYQSVPNYQSLLTANGALTGRWKPDGRRVDPNDAIDTTPRSAFLSSFIGSDPNGDWTLFVEDNSSSGVGTLTGWRLTITTADVTVVPEPSTYGVMAVGVVALLSFLTRKRNQRT